MLVSQGFTIPRFAKDAWVEGGVGGWFLDKSLWIGFIVFPPFVCVCVRVRALEISPSFTNQELPVAHP